MGALPYRIATDYKTRADGRPQILARTHGPVSPARLTHNVDLSRSATENHHAAALALAIKKSWRQHNSAEPDVTVTECGSNDAGTKRDFEVSL